MNRVKNERLVCPTCRISFSMAESSTPPFCSERCQMIDLGQWLNEENGLPFEGDPGDSPVEYRSEDD